MARVSGAERLCRTDTAGRPTNGMKVADKERLATQTDGAFVVRAPRDERHLELVLRGVVERRAARNLLVALQRSMRSVDRATLDVRDLTFIDSSGLYALLAVKAICSEHDIDLEFRTIAQDPLQPPERATRRSHFLA
jgi:ABC-type transporter Mla MlaB component